MPGIAFQQDAFQNVAFQTQNVNVVLLFATLQDANDTSAATFSQNTIAINNRFVLTLTDGQDTLDSFSGVRILFNAAFVDDDDFLTSSTLQVFNIGNLLDIASQRTIITHPIIERTIVIR